METLLLQLVSTHPGNVICVRRYWEVVGFFNGDESTCVRDFCFRPKRSTKHDLPED